MTINIYSLCSQRTRKRTHSFVAFLKSQQNINDAKLHCETKTPFNLQVIYLHLNSVKVI